MHLDRHTCRRTVAAVFPVTVLITTYILKTLQFSDILAVASTLFSASITAGICLETSYRFLVKEATAPLDKLIEKL
ncbi:MAG: hypothetical protein ABEK16_04095 [Candidatus Nanohalobium sp.]